MEGGREIMGNELLRLLGHPRGISLEYAGGQEHAPCCMRMKARMKHWRIAIGAAGKKEQ